MPGCYAFSHKVLDSDDGLFIKVSGCLTERSDLSFMSEPRHAHLVLDLSGVDRVNSGGVRIWVEAVRKTGAEGTRLELVRCAPSIVRQLNMISNFADKAVVRSVMAPYYCGMCGEEKDLLVELQGRTAPEVPAWLPCPGCGGKMEFDDLIETYFSFLEHTRTP